jgi:predicted permease
VERYFLLVLHTFFLRQRLSVNASEKFSFASALGKVVLIPAIMLPIAALLGFDQLEMAILLAVFATPNAVSSYAMARSYEADYELAGEIITLGTLLSVVTMFVFITMAKSLLWI